MTKHDFYDKWCTAERGSKEAAAFIEDLEKLLEDACFNKYIGPPPAYTVKYAVKRPHKCPVCGGRGLVSNTLYGNNQITNYYPGDVTCRSCNGAGVLWG